MQKQLKIEVIQPEIRLPTDRVEGENIILKNDINRYLNKFISIIQSLDLTNEKKEIILSDLNYYLEVYKLKINEYGCIEVGKFSSICDYNEKIRKTIFLIRDHIESDYYLDFLQLEIGLKTYLIEFLIMQIQNIDIPESVYRKVINDKSSPAEVSQIINIDSEVEKNSRELEDLEWQSVREVVSKYIDDIFSAFKVGGSTFGAMSQYIENHLGTLDIPLYLEDYEPNQIVGDYKFPAPKEYILLLKRTGKELLIFLKSSEFKNYLIGLNFPDDSITKLIQRVSDVPLPDILLD